MADLVDSTAINVKLGDEAMSRLWDLHDGLSRELALVHNGREVDRTDGFLMLFETPSSAISFAFEYHRQLDLLSVPLRARVAIHVGPVRLRENSEQTVAVGAKPIDVLGIAKAKTARLMAIARGGQTLVSAEVAIRIPAGSFRLASHGHWRLKGLDEPEEIFEVGDEFAPMLPPADGEKATRVTQRSGQWISLAQVPHRLPGERDAFIGRAFDLRNLARRFADSQTRMVVLHGPGGIGKTRLALRFAWSWLGRFPGGAYFCDLTSARDLDGVLHAVAHSLNVPLLGEPEAQLGHALAAHGRSLIILDNFEQVAHYAQETVGRWLEAAPEMHFLVTSRETTGLPGEEVIAVDSLPNDEAASLFTCRARAAGAAVDARAFDSETIGRLISLLDGLPLAIELAAARSRVMSPGKLLARMNERFTVLGSRVGRVGRQATMRTVIDASWDALTSLEQSVLAQLSIFEGGFDLKAAEAVLQAGNTPVWVPEVIQGLVDKSLLRVMDADRFSMLSIIQSYAAERLCALPVIAELVTRRHWEYFASLDVTSATSQRGIEIDNLVAACRRATAAGEAIAAAACMLPAWAALRRVGPLSVANDLARSLMDVAAIPASAAAVATWVDAAARLAAGEYALARPGIEKGLRMAGAGLPSSLEARLHCTAGELETASGNHVEALRHLEMALSAANACDDTALQCQVLNALGALDTERGLLDRARLSYEKALSLARVAEDLHWQGGVLGNIAVLEYARGNLAEAAAALTEALRMAEASSDLRWEGNARCNLGLTFLEQGKSEDALAQFALASAIAHRVGLRTLENVVHCNTGLSYEAVGDLASACRAHFDAVRGARESGDSRSEVHFSAYLGSALCRVGKLGESAAVLSQSLQLAESIGDPLLHALVLVSLAELDLRCEGPATARVDIDRARSMASGLVLDDRSELGKRFSSVEALIRG